MNITVGKLLCAITGSIVMLATFYILAAALCAVGPDRW